MSHQAEAFLGSWIVTNVHPSGMKAAGDTTEAAQLAADCVALAAAQQITRADFETEVGDLDEHMRLALNIAQDAVDQAATRPQRSSR
ncbi:DUF768 domain-containing protein [Lichenihabitans psoromatis]|uniref:DUF768 domain-containing protein n=1 Tax=Lichenihabitans psoromatis TaxID=2528642 RepID=UPI0010364B50|nr:DUF768 domain-containing protein [Lichenihabitans psoromatis]